jgi:hypothetical protein
MQEIAATYIHPEPSFSAVTVSSGIYKDGGLKTGRRRSQGTYIHPELSFWAECPDAFPSGHEVEARILPPCFSANPSSFF